jgi:hypothetical protein
MDFFLRNNKNKNSIMKAKYVNEKYNENSNYNFEIETYRKLVAFCLEHGFKYSHYERKGDYLTVFNDTIPGSRISTPYKNVADRFERWFKWMKK